MKIRFETDVIIRGNMNGCVEFTRVSPEGWAWFRENTDGYPEVGPVVRVPYLDGGTLFMMMVEDRIRVSNIITTSVFGSDEVEA